MTGESVVKDAPPEPILATVVPPPPSPYQFGLKALMGLMAVCCVQFALMSYLGIVQGMLAGIGISGAALAGILVYAVLFVRSQTPLMEKLDYVGIRLVVAITVLLIGTVIAGGGVAIYETVSDLHRAMTLEQKLGIRTVRIDVWDDTRSYQALKILLVYNGSVASNANLRTGEVVVLEGTVTEFYQRLDENRGRAFSFTVAGPPVGGSIEKAPRRQVTIVVPK